MNGNKHILSVGRKAMTGDQRAVRRLNRLLSSTNPDLDDEKVANFRLNWLEWRRNLHSIHQSTARGSNFNVDTTEFRADANVYRMRAAAILDSIGG